MCVVARKCNQQLCTLGLLKVQYYNHLSTESSPHGLYFLSNKCLFLLIMSSVLSAQSKTSNAFYAFPRNP